MLALGSLLARGHDLAYPNLRFADAVVTAGCRGLRPAAVAIADQLELGGVRLPCRASSTSLIGHRRLLGEAMQWVSRARVAMVPRRNPE
jgi:hypothetical protein